MAFGDIVALYRSCKKKVDINWFTEWLCRPAAAVLVYALQGTRITPNQLSFLSLFCAMGAGALLATQLSDSWLIVAVGINHIAFILDCSDGMLARCRQSSSVLGHLLDFLMDELKAMVIFACVTVRLWQIHGDALYLLCGLGGLFALATGLTLTSFMRRPEYSGALPTEDGQPAHLPTREGLGKGLSLIEHAARSIVHYPQYIWLCALADRIDLYFWAYGAVNVLYITKAGGTILWRLGRLERRTD